jgi:bleomycin hydrolase
MKKTILLFVGIAFLSQLFAQDHEDKAVFKKFDKGESYYYSTILSGINSYQKEKKEEKPFRLFKVDVSGRDFPNKVDMYKNQAWHNPPISQGSTGTCWCFSTISFYESEVYRMTKQKVKLSEMYLVYWEYVEKAKGYVNSRGTSLFSEGSEGNAVARLFKSYGVVPFSEYSGLLPGQSYYNHQDMFKEMETYLKSIKKSNSWNEDDVVATIKSILNHYMGVPPTEVVVDGKKMSPQGYLKNVLKLNPNDYVEILSYSQEPFYQQCIYDVPDNWWKSNEYYNIPLEEYMKVFERSIKKGYTMSIGGDVSETGLVAGKGEPQVAIIPSYDIPYEYINDDAREFRFNNKTTTDDHGMHCVGSMKKDGHTWYLIKDSSSGSRNNDPNAKEFGYYFFRDDFVKLKMMGFTVHKDAVKDILKKFEEVNK